MDFSTFGDLLGSAGSSSLDGAFAGVGTDYGGALSAGELSSLGVGDLAGQTGAQVAGDSVSSIAGETSQQLIANAGVDAGLSGGAGAGSLSGLTGSQVIDQFGGSLGSSGSGAGNNFLKSLGPASKSATQNLGKYTPQLQTRALTLPGHMYMRTHETPDAQKGQKVQSVDPRQIWMQWYQNMNNFVYRGR